MQRIISPPMDDHTRTLIRLAVEEDLGPSHIDRTVDLTIDARAVGEGTIVARTKGTIAGTFLLHAIAAEYGGGLSCEIVTGDGERVTPGQAIAKVRGPVRAILSAERTLLNFLGHLSGIATLTAKYVDAIADLEQPPVIVDTRKTMPGFRQLDKYAVRCGGGVNHRMGLYDGVMLKDNHLASLRENHDESLAQMTRRVRAPLDSALLLWLEVDTLDQLAAALPGGGADIILLDNFSADQLRAAVALRSTLAKGRKNGSAPFPLLEASGGVTLGNLRAIAETGVDRIAIGALTHSAPVLDVSMEFA